MDSNKKSPEKKSDNKNESHTMDDDSIYKATSLMNSAMKIDISKVLQLASQQIKVDMSKVLQLASQQIKVDMSKFLQNAKLASLRSDYLKTAKPYVSVLDGNRLATIPVRNQLRTSIGFYSKKELEPVKSPSEVRHDTKAGNLLSLLQKCPLGKPGWNKYQDICKEILIYCLVPPLKEPLEQEETRDRLHIRDLIFHIPYDINGFWTFFLGRFGMALVIECKNYSTLIKENQLRISSKYVGENKLSTFGLIITRKGLHENGIKAQEKIWRDDKKMLLCMNDEHLEKMLQLKSESEEPWKVIDSLIRDFLSSLS